MANATLLLETGKINFRQFGLYRYLLSIEARQWKTDLDRLARITQHPAEEVTEDIFTLTRVELLTPATLQAVIEEA